MKKILALCLTAALCLCCFSSCNLSHKIQRFIPNEQIMSVEIETTNYETGLNEIGEKYVLTATQSDEIKALLGEITYEKRYNLLQEKWTYFNEVKYIFTFETQRIVLSENHICIYDNDGALLKHVEFNSSTFDNYLEEISEVLSASDLSHTNVFDKGMEDTATIKIDYFDISSNPKGTVIVTDETSIKHIVDNITSLKLKPCETEHGEPSSIKYKLRFSDADEKTIRTMNISPDGRINFCDVISGELDTAYLEGLFTAPDEDHGKNDIFYAAAYPQDFEYNGRHYHLVHGDGSQATATQEDLGELLGYIIREEDISAFTGECPNVDYVIVNGIYDYDTNNRVAFYSLKAYPDLNIICMHQLGDYVLFQDERSCQTN